MHTFERPLSGSCETHSSHQISVIKRENPELRLHNAIPCDLMSTGAAANVCACTIRSLLAWPQGSVPNVATPSSPACASTRWPRAACLFEHAWHFCGLWMLEVGVGGVKCCWVNSLPSIFTSDLLKGCLWVLPQVLKMYYTAHDCHMCWYIHSVINQGAHAA